MTRYAIKLGLQYATAVVDHGFGRGAVYTRLERAQLFINIASALAYQEQHRIEGNVVSVELESK